MKQKIIFLVFILFTSISCNKNDEDPTSKSGYFSLTEIKSPSLKSTQSINDETIKNEFALGDLKASKEFYFLLSNSSDKPIFDINLKTDNSQFNILPESISSLPENNSDDNNSFLSLITLGIVHGKQLNGVGYTNLLPMGKNSAKLTITGKIIEGADTIETESDFSFEIDAKVMDIKLTESGAEIDLLKPAGAITSQKLGEILRYYNVKSKTINIANTGNVDINVATIAHADPAEEGLYINYKKEILLSQNQSTDLEIPDSPAGLIISLNSYGTITDYYRIRLGSDGQGYLMVNYGNN